MEDLGSSAPFPFEDPRQKRVYERLLNHLGPGPAAFFLDACRMMARHEDLRTTTHLVAHCLREIESALRDVLAGRSIDREGDENAVDLVEEILGALEIDRDEEVARVWLALHQTKGKQLHGKAHRRGLRRPRPVDQDFEVYWDNIQRVLDTVLDRFETRSNEIFEVLDELLGIATPTREDVKRLSDHLPNNLVTRGYFFRRLRHPEWLPPLRRKKFFRSPPRSYRDPITGELRMPPWPEVEYLKAMTEQKPDDIVEIILGMDDTDNVRVHQSVVEVASTLPGPKAAKLVNLVLSWIDRHDDLLVLNERAKDYVIHLGAEECIDEALRVTRTLLGLSPDEDRPDLLGPKPRARMSAWHYAKALEEIGSQLGSRVPHVWLEMLSDLLDDAMEFSIREGAGNSPPEDLSNIWRPAIESHDQNVDHEEPAEALVSALRDAALQVLSDGGLSFEEVLEVLKTKNWKVFRRIGLFLAAQYEPVGDETLRELILDKESFNDTTLHHEYFGLLRNKFDHLSAEDQAILLSWIEQGPDSDKVKGWLKIRQEKVPDEGAVDERIDRWRYRKLLPIRESLPEEWEDKLRDYERRFGELEHPDFYSYSTGGWMGPRSPRTAEELSALDVTEVARVLREWEPPDDWESPTPEGLGRVLTEVVSDDPDRFSEKLELFVDVDPTYARSIVRGFQNALEKENHFEWEPVLEFGQNIIEQPRSVEDERRNVRNMDRDPHWGWARKALGSLLRKGLSADPALSIPFQLRRVVWGLIEELLNDPDPIPEYEREYGGSNMDPATMSINTVRGTALHAAITYGRWVRQNVQSKRNSSLGDEGEFVGSQEVPELFTALDEMLRVDEEPAVSVRAVYGQWFPLLVWLDEEWAKSRGEQIFDPSDSRMWDAAWRTYVWANRPTPRAFAILQERYAHGVAKLASTESDSDLRGRPHEKLAGHLMALYWWGILDLSEDGLIRTFFELAPPETRAYALKFVGRSLGSLDADPDPDVVERLKKLWAFRREAAENEGASDTHATEMAAFVWWFRSGRLDPVWMLEHLGNAATLTGELADDAWLALDRLVELAAEYPEATVDCLSQLVIHDRKEWLTAARREEIGEVLRTALAQGEPASNTARETINRLVGRGHVEFRDLLD